MAVFFSWLSAEDEGEEMEEEPDEPSLEEQLATVKDELNLGATRAAQL